MYKIINFFAKKKVLTIASLYLTILRWGQLQVLNSAIQKVLQYKFP